MSTKTRSDGLVMITPAADYTGKEGYGVTISGTTSIVATISASATVPWDAVIVEGGTVAQGVTIAILGATPGAVEMKISGTVYRGNKLVQSTDGTAVADTGSGARVKVGVADESGVSADRISAFLRTPVEYAS